MHSPVTSSTSSIASNAQGLAAVITWASEREGNDEKVAQDRLRRARPHVCITCSTNSVQLGLPQLPAAGLAIHCAVKPARPCTMKHTAAKAARLREVEARRFALQPNLRHRGLGDSTSSARASKGSTPRASALLADDAKETYVLVSYSVSLFRHDTKK